MTDRMVKICFPLTHLSRSTASTNIQNRDLEDFLLNTCVSYETVKDLAWFSNVPDRTMEIFFFSPTPLALPPPRAHKIAILGIFSSANSFLTKL